MKEQRTGFVPGAVGELQLAWNHLQFRVAFFARFCESFALSAFESAVSDDQYGTIPQTLICRQCVLELVRMLSVRNRNCHLPRDAYQFASS